jgi:hypothetical protein
MPKRVFGTCPVCGRFIAKRGGKLRVHYPTEVKRGNLRPDTEDLCTGSGKRVKTHQYD